MEKTVFKSNGATVADGVRVTEVVDGRLFVLVDPKEKRYSEVTVKIIDDPAPVDPDPVDTDPTPDPDPDPVEPTPVDGGELLAAIQSASGGEVLEASGVVESLVLYGLTFADPVTIKGATIKALVVNSCEGIIFDGCHIDYDYQPGQPTHYTVASINGSKRVTMKDCRITGSGGPDGYGYGFGLVADYCEDFEVSGTGIRTFQRGLMIRVGTNIRVADNNITDISGDSMAFSLCKDIVIEGNYVHDFRSDPASEFHKDMLQFWSKDDTQPSENITIRNNIFDIGEGAWTQSIFMRNEAVDADGRGPEMFYQNVVIEGNTIKNAHLHGITVGETNGLIVRDNNIERKLNPDHPANAGWDGRGSVTVPGIFATATYTGEVVVSGNTAPRIEIGNPAWDGGGNTVTGTGA